MAPSFLVKTDTVQTISLRMRGHEKEVYGMPSSARRLTDGGILRYSRWVKRETSRGASLWVEARKLRYGSLYLALSPNLRVDAYYVEQEAILIERANRRDAAPRRRLLS